MLDRMTGTLLHKRMPVSKHFQQHPTAPQNYSNSMLDHPTILRTVKPHGVMVGSSHGVAKQFNIYLRTNIM